MAKYDKSSKIVNHILRLYNKNKNYIHMKRLKILIISLSISMAFPGLLLAQRSGIVMGKVIDGSSEEPLAYANVHIKGTTIS